MSLPDAPKLSEVKSGLHDARAALWHAFRSADGARAYCERWLEYLHAERPELAGGLVLSAAGDDFAPLAHWPPDLDVAVLADCAEQSLADGGREVVMASPNGAAIALPVFALGELQALAVFAVTPGAAEDVRQPVRWSLAWLEVLFLRRAASTGGPDAQPVYRALECVAAIVDKADHKQSSNALVSELAAMFDCDRVSLGLLDGEDLRVAALSDTAAFGQQMNLIGHIEAAMEEALDQGDVVVWPPPDRNAFLVTLAHDALSQQAADSAICTIPLVARDVGVGALTLERGDDQPFDERAVRLLDVIGSLCAAPLVDRRDAERALPRLALERAAAQLRRVFGPGYPGRKLVLAVVIVLVAAASLWTTTYRVAGDAVLRGAEQRAVTAPIDGYVDRAPARAGDRLDPDDVLLTLDDRDLQIERLKLVTERAQFEQQRKQAVAARERASVNVLEAQIAQAGARLALIDEQLERTRVTMPFAGFVVSGDFSQSLGAPVRRGDLLYEIAPSDAYRVIIDVDESQLDDVHVGATGSLRLNALPEDLFDVAVTRVTPVTKAREGGNYFEVEARIDGERSRLRPGMRGVGKIEVDERRVVWVWTRALRAWLTLQWWRWSP